MKSQHVLSASWVLLAMTGPCGEQGAAPPTPQAERAPLSSSPPTSAAQPAPAPAAATGAPPGRQQTLTTRSYMLTHYADTAALRQALVAGKLAAAQAAAAAVAADGWTPKLRGDYLPHVTAVRQAAGSVQQAPNLQQAARGLAQLGTECASCHAKFAGTGAAAALEPASEAQDPTMVAHAAGTERAWLGLVLPSDASWSSGMELLLDAPALDSDVTDVATAARRLQGLAQRGRSADGEQRSDVFADILLTCAGCHERLGVGAGAARR